MSGGYRIIISSLPALLYFTLHNGDTSIKKIQKNLLDYVSLAVVEASATVTVTIKVDLHSYAPLCQRCKIH